MTTTPSILDPPPPATRADLAALRELLRTVPAKQVDRNLMVATWNIREFGRFTRAWEAPGRGATRDMRAIRCIGEVIARFDIVAIQEVQEDIAALQALMVWLGPEWAFVMTDVTRGKTAGSERLAFVFDTRRVKPSGLAAELVLSAEDLAGTDPATLHEQIARTPYSVAFRESHGLTFVLTTVHIRWGHGESDRTPEIHALARWFKEWSDELERLGHDCIVLGDWNIAKLEDANYEALTSTGLETPPQLAAAAARADGGAPRRRAYDQIAWFPRRLRLRFSGRCGFVDWRGRILTDFRGDDVTYRISDHDPLWVEFAVSETDPV